MGEKSEPEESGGVGVLLLADFSRTSCRMANRERSERGLFMCARVGVRTIAPTSARENRLKPA